MENHSKFHQVKARQIAALQELLPITSGIFLRENFEAQKFNGQVVAGMMTVSVSLIVVLVKIKVTDGKP